MAEYCCPIGGNTLETNPKPVDGVWFVYSPRAGGVYRLTGEWSRRGLSWTLNHQRYWCRQGGMAQSPGVPGKGYGPAIGWTDR